jgi:hypothetical protein
MEYRKSSDGRLWKSCSLREVKKVLRREFKGHFTLDDMKSRPGAVFGTSRGFYQISVL